jgi:small-conductance mechanosensitive channel
VLIDRGAPSQTSGLEAEAQRARQELAALEQQLAEAAAVVEHADARERQARQAAAAGKRRQWEMRAALTQLTQAPPPELLAGTQAGGEDGSQADIWQVGRQAAARLPSCITHCWPPAAASALHRAALFLACGPLLLL